MENKLRRDISIPGFNLPPGFMAHLPMILFWAVFAVGALLRLYDFPNVPHGLNQDEISSAYESWSLLTTGGDRWGYHLPVYFLGPGSGQNVLYSYLSVPVVALFGLSTIAVRLVALIFGILLLPLLYVTVKSFYGRRIALFTMLIVAVIPWHVMASRWGLESNLLPFFFLLGVYLLWLGLQPDARRWQRMITLLPFAAALYAYGLSVVPIIGLFALVAVFYHRALWMHWRSWLVAVVLFLVVATPFLLFFVKNYVTHQAWPFEQYLPFSMPMLTVTRLDEVNAHYGGSPFMANLNFIQSGFQDYFPWNSLAMYPPVPQLILLVAVAELVRRIVRTGINARHRRFDKPDLIILWLIASLPLLFILHLDVNQANVMILPLLVLAASGAMRLLKVIPWRSFQGLAVALVLLGVLLPAEQAFVDYHGPDYQLQTANVFNPGLAQALPAAAKEADGKPLYVSDGILLNYVQTLWYLHIPATEFQKYHPHPKTADFANFLFYHTDLVDRHGYYTLLRALEPSPCANMQRVGGVSGYQIGYCS